jgi:hypothetical protein
MDFPLIRSACISMVLGPTLAWAQDVEEVPQEAPPVEQEAPPVEAEASPEEPPEPAAPEDLSRHRISFNALVERSIGTTSAPVAFNWRESTVQVAATSSFLVELNNFNSARVGVLARIPTNGLIVEVGLNYAEVWDTPSSVLLSRTPYRQAGRPDRGELDVALGLPLAEGIVTTAPKWFPAVQLVFNAYGGLRYSIYPTGYRGMNWREVGGALVSPSLSLLEVENLEDARLAAMQVDPGRYGLTAGFGNDIYFKQGLFLSPRVMFGVPLLAPASQTELFFWADLSLAFGVAF